MISTEVNFAEMKSTRRRAAPRALSGMMKFSFDPGRAKELSTLFRLFLAGAMALFAAGIYCPPALAQAAVPTAAGDESVASAEVAKLPYQQLVTIARNNSTGSVAETGAADGGTDGGEVKEEVKKLMLRVSSTKGVPADKITLTIMRVSGPVAIPILAKGGFEVPWSQEIFDENPMVVSNLPKETMNLNFTIAIPEVRPKVVDGKVRYQSLFTQLLEAQKEIRKTNPDFGKPGFDTLAIQIVGGQKEVAIERSLGTRTIQPDAAGDVWLVYDLLLFEENPNVTLPEKAQVNIVPVDARDSIRIRAQ